MGRKTKYFIKLKDNENQYTVYAMNQEEAVNEFTIQYPDLEYSFIIAAGDYFRRSIKHG